MNREKLEEWLKEISTPTGLSYSGDQTLSNSEVYTILEYVDDLQSKIDKANEILNRPQFEYDNIPCNYEEDIKELKYILKEDK